MKLTWKTGLAAALSLLANIAANPAAAQSYPDKPVTLLMPYAAGGPGDVLTRIYAQPLAKALGPVIREAGIYAD